MQKTLHYAFEWRQSDVSDVILLRVCLYAWPQLTGQPFFLGTFNYSKTTGGLNNYLMTHKSRWTLPSQC